MSGEVRVGGLGGPPGEIFVGNNSGGRKEELNKTISQKIREENIRAEIEKEREKEIKDKMNKQIISEDDLKMLLLVFGSRGSTTLLEGVIEKKKKEQRSTQ